MGIPSPVEDLAWLVKDNLHAKYLVLSVEELFVEFLECPLSGEETLALEPMVSYQRMLLHRLADLFGLAHESVGEGDDRHLVVEKCEDSLIPATLVSDVLEIGVGSPEDAHESFSARQLLRRDTLSTDQYQTPLPSKDSTLSLEDRQAAYLAARQRIFSRTWKPPDETPKGIGSARPRSDPVVARRMIAHALGKPQKLAFPSPLTDAKSLEDTDSQKLPVYNINDGMSAERTRESLKASEPVQSESMQQSSVKAAKRLFAHALGLPPAGTSSRITPRQPASATGSGKSSAQASCGEDGSVALSTARIESYDSEDATRQRGSHCFESREIGALPVTPRHACPGIAARRIFAQALGLPHPIASSESSRPPLTHQSDSVK